MNRLLPSTNEIFSHLGVDYSNENGYYLSCLREWNKFIKTKVSRLSPCLRLIYQGLKRICTRSFWHDIAHIASSVIYSFMVKRIIEYALTFILLGDIERCRFFYGWNILWWKAHRYFFPQGKIIKWSCHYCSILFFCV